MAALRLPLGVETHDVLQAARLGMAGAIAGWRPGGAPFSIYAKTCVRRRAITAIDQARTARQCVLADAASLDALAEAGREPVSTHDASDPVKVVMAREQLRSIIVARRTLSSREAASLNGWINGVAYVDVATSLGCTKKAVALAVRRARDRLGAAADIS